MMKNELNAEFNWYVIYTYPHFEKKVHSSLLKANISCFLPLQKVVRQWSDRKKTMEIALFPNYVFVQTTNKEKHNVLNIYGVSRYVCFDGKPVAISEKEMDMIKKVVIEPGLMVEQHIEVGDSISIVDGPFSGLKGVVFERKGKTRFGIKIPAINQFLSFEVQLSSIRKAEENLCW